VRLGAWCDLVPDELSTASPGSVSFDVHEFAVLADGRRLVLHRERGFSLSGPSDPWAFLTAASIEADVRTTVLPDEDGPDEHPYAWLAGLLHAHGVTASAQQLRAVPYVVELSDRVRQRLAPRADGA